MSALLVPRRPRGVIAIAVALVLVEAIWVLAGLGHEWSHPVIGWLPTIAMAALGAYACRRTALRPDLTDGTRRFWHTLALADCVLTVAEVTSAHDALGGPAPRQYVGPVTTSLLLVVVLLTIWALLRLPAWHRSRGDWARFALDAGVLVITCGGLLWRYWLASNGQWTAQNTAMLAVCALALITMIAIVKITFAGAGELDRGALRLLSAGVAISALSGSLGPAFADRPWLSTSLLSGPIASLFTVIAAERQRHAVATPVTGPTPAPRISVLPYLAVAAMSAVLLIGEAADGGAQLGIAICVSALTALVVIRQISALRDNRRLLATVDANLARLQEYQAELDHEISHDALTGIANRSLFADEVTSRLANGESFHVALLDLDDFKVINDRMGHGMGDALLRAVTERLHEKLRPSDFVARQGGDEFTLLLTGDGASDLLRDVLDRVQEPLSLNGQDLAPRVSIGVTAARRGDTPEELIRRADVAMYAAKNTGGGRCTWFDPIMDQIADADARLAADLRQAIARDELFLLYQPIVELPHGRLAGVEALIRWRHPTHGLVSPGVFIPLAERNGYIVELGRWVLREAVRQAREWELAYGDAAPEKVSVNISARQLREPGFPAEVAELLRTSGLTPHRLVAEVTETAVLGTGESLDAVRALHALGLRIALDDFGTGQSSLSLLVDCPVKVLKVDKSFVDGVTGASAQAVIVDGLIGITEGLKIEAVAEGVETADQAYRLHKMGYRFAQGFHFARPMPGADIALLLDVVPASRKVDNLH
ncbi:putative bifunctional diguanylate cyclase/phosphodiesterase [Paractinoplanes globisporus]|uniref:Bifunctional diguanylate cyclase/phosphodiesterase n=1 Tax=Paractinoplanes globisporus TaxID=113565 RepID=A0ABW6WNK6_9ACTN|nr:bifunctional diguanylate cyclase/phosphodiesterase [Actinoplanes globisporus]